MKRLWSPWRMKYIKSPKQKGCVFCKVLSCEDDAKNNVLYRGKDVFVILNAYPYTSGHLMVLPNIHVPALDDLTPEIRAGMMELVNKAIQVLTEVYQPQGFNVGINLGEAAGAGIEEHLHIHVVPRWHGDVNFMTAVGETRVLPEALEDTYRRVMELW